MTTAFGDRELQVEIGFDCALALSHSKRGSGGFPPSVSLSSATASVQKPVNGFATVPAGANALCVNIRGALLARSAGVNKLILIPPRSIVFVRGGTKLSLQAARGDHDALLLSWLTGVAPALENWITAKATGKGGANRAVACRAIDPHLSSFVTRLEAVRSGPEDLAEPMLLSLIHEGVAQLLSEPNEMQLATVPSDLPKSVKELIREVRGNSAQSWPLKDAADRAGYSPFHFSRVFKQMVGYGFHEYVDRCRTESAVEMLVGSDSAIDLVASACGFGTTQGLRESIKEYLGLVPSELRTIPESTTPR
ncbi:MAG TPA: AraC family transcriptional regulator [Fimbriimonadaceae bacterium]|nr:AraC family transcriptional regulator [Fimbriimonadaceae bacterium]